MSHGEVIEYSTQLIRLQKESEETFMGYIYPHAPVEILSAHGLTPTLVMASPEVKGGFESSLQTYTCSLARNIFSQRQNETLSSLDGILFPGNTCDSLQNVADVWRKRFPKDKVFRLTYPAAIKSESAIQFLTKELLHLSNSLEKQYGKKLSKQRLNESISLWNQFRDVTQFLYAARVSNPSIISYKTLVETMREYLSIPSLSSLELLKNLSEVVEEEMNPESVRTVQNGLMSNNPAKIDLPFDDSRTRILITGGMVEPMAISNLFNHVQEEMNADIVLDLLSYGFKTAFSPFIDGADPFRASAESILSSPLEPTQEGLSHRMHLLKGYLVKLGIDALVICEQSFCDPDQFEAPSMLRVAKELKVPVTRLPLDPELSDKSRNEGRLQTLIESIQGGE